MHAQGDAQDARPAMYAYATPLVERRHTFISSYLHTFMPTHLHTCIPSYLTYIYLYDYTQKCKSLNNNI